MCFLFVVGENGIKQNILCHLGSCHPHAWFLYSSQILFFIGGKGIGTLSISKKE